MPVSLLTDSVGGKPLGRIILSAQVMEYNKRMRDNSVFNCRHNVRSTTCGASSSPSDSILNMQTKSFKPENTVNENYCAQSLCIDVETTQHSQSTHKNNNEEHCRNVIGQETLYLPSTSKVAALESAPRERKRWVRPPLVGQASTSDNSTVIQDMSLEAVSNMGTEYDSHHSVQDELLQPNCTDKKNDYSVAMSPSMNEIGLHKALCILPEVNDLKPYSSSLGKESKMEACRDVKVLNEVWGDVECDKVSDNRENCISCSCSVMVSSPLDIQDQTYSPSDQNQDCSVIVTETVGSGRALSPASVSSVTSSRRLEWDSGADVGYQNFQPHEFPSGEGLSSIERIALARGCSAAQRLEPEGTAGSVQLKPVTKISKFNSNVPMAMSTPLAFGQTVASSVAGADNEIEITPIQKLQGEKCIFHEEEFSHHHSANRHTTPFLHHQVQSAECKEGEGCNIMSKKVSTSLTDLNECGLHEAHKDLLSRSRSCLSLLSKEDFRTKSFQYSNSGSFPLQHQYKRNSCLATCSASSSSIATVVPNLDSPRISGKVVQTSAFHVPFRNSVGIQVSETAKDCKSLVSSPSFPHKVDGHDIRHVTSNLEQDMELEGSDSDIVEKTDSNIAEDIRNAKHVHNSQLSSVEKNNYSHVSQIQPQNNSFQNINCHKLQCNRTNANQNSAVCKGAHKRGGNEHQWCLSAARTQQTVSERHARMSEDANVQRPHGRLNSNSIKPVVQSYVNQSEEEATGTLDSLTSSTRTVGSWFIGDTPQSNGNQNENESGRRGSSGVVGSANSFEYLPGHVYENNTLAVDINLYRKAITEDSSSESVSSHPLAGFIDSKFKINDDRFWGSSISSTFATDLEKGIALLKDLLNSKSCNSNIKKKLVRQVVNRLIETSYAEDNVLLESNVPWVPPKSLVNSGGYNVKKVGQEDMSGGHKVGRTMEREEVSGESASEQQGSRKPQVNHQPVASSTTHQDYFIAGKCAKTGLSESSGLSSLSERIPSSENHADSRAETTTSTTQGHVGSSSTSTTFTRNGYTWKESTTQSEKEYEQQKHKSGKYSDNSMLLNLCETERENQLSWISTEIHHLNALKQLLGKERHLRNDLQSFGMQNCKENQKKIRNLVTSQKSSEVATEPESFRSDVTHGSSISEIHVRKSHNLKHIDNKSEPSSSKSPKKNRKSSKFPSEIHQNLSDPNIKTVSLDKRDIFTQFPTAVELYDKKSSYNCTNDKLQLKEKAVQAPILSDISTNGDTYKLTGSMLSDSTVSGRINAFMQTRKRNSVTDKDSQGSELTDAHKYTRKASESNDCHETVVKELKSNDSPLCCCDLKKLLAEISKEIRFKKQRSEDKKSIEGNVKASGSVAKQRYISSSGRTIQSKNMDDNSGRSCTISSSRTLGDVIELPCDSDQVRASVATETVTNIGVQTTQSLRSLPLIRPQWYSLITEGKEKVASKAENDIGSSCKVCPCCGALEAQNDTISESSQDTTSEWKCSRCLKLEQAKRYDRKCQICGVLESQLQISQQDGIQNHDTSWKCSDCLARKLDNARPVFDKCMNCGLQKDCNERKEKQIDFGSTGKITSTTQKSPIGYILTLETSTDPVSSMAERSEKKMLEEIKIKVPERKNHLISAKGKRRKKFQKAVSKSSMKFSKENHKSVTSMEDRSFPEDELQRNKRREEHTLQEYLMARRPDFIQNAEYRRQCLHELAYLRELRQESRQLLALASHIPHFNGDNTASVNIGPLPQSPMAIKRIFSQHTMRAQTERKYRSLPEVLSKKAEKKKKEDFRTNRLMAEIFARKLQRRVLKGDVNLSNSRSVISVI